MSGFILASFAIWILTSRSISISVLLGSLSGQWGFKITSFFFLFEIVGTRRKKNLQVVQSRVTLNCVCVWICLSVCLLPKTEIRWTGNVFKLIYTHSKGGGGAVTNMSYQTKSHFFRKGELPNKDNKHDDSFRRKHDLLNTTYLLDNPWFFFLSLARFARSNPSKK